MSAESSSSTSTASKFAFHILRPIVIVFVLLLFSVQYCVANGQHIESQWYAKITDTILDVHKTHNVIQPTIYDGQNQRKILTTTRQTPPAPPYLRLRGFNSRTFDLDIGAQKVGDPDPMDIIGYRFEILSKDDYRNNGGKWLNARVIQKEFTDGITYNLIEHLSPDTSYLVRVAAQNQAGLSDWIGPEEFRTQIDSVATTTEPSSATV